VIDTRDADRSSHLLGIGSGYAATGGSLLQLGSHSPAKVPLVAPCTDFITTKPVLSKRLNSPLFR